MVAHAHANDAAGRPARSDVDGREPGIAPVAPAHRTLSGFDIGILWGDLGIGLLVLVTGALLVPGLGLAAASAAIVVGSFIGVALLATAGVAGAQTGLPTMVLFRPILGIRGSWLPTGLNILQLIGWTAVELWAISFVADTVARRVFGVSARPVWLIAAAVVCGGLSLWGPVAVTRVWMKRFGAWVLLAIVAIITPLVASSEHGVSSAGTGGFPTFGPALDLVIAMPVSWMPLIADYNRFARGTRSAFAGTFLGYFVANVWLYLLGALLVLRMGATPDPGGIAEAILTLTGGSVAALLLLLGLLVGETDEAFADIYSGAVSARNVAPRVRHGWFVAGITTIAAALAWTLTMTRYELFLFLLGSVFVPLFGVFIADHFVNRSSHVVVEDLYSRDGRYWYGRGIRWSFVVPLLAGFVVYHWIAPTGPAAWVSFVESAAGGPVSADLTWLPASIPSFAVAFLLTLAVGRISSGAPTRRER